MIKRPLRRPRAPSAEARDRILEAALEHFSSKGYARSLISEIAATAEVSSALVIQHFKTKDNLFENALSKSLSRINDSQRADRTKIRAADLLAIDTSTTQAFSMLVHSVGDPQTSSSALGLFEEYILSDLTKSIGGPEADGLAHAAAAILLGFATLRLIDPSYFSNPGDSELLRHNLTKVLANLGRAGDRDAVSQGKDQLGRFRVTRRQKISRSE